MLTNFLILLAETLEENVKYSERNMGLDVMTTVLPKIHVLREVAQWCWWTIWILSTSAV